MKILRYYRNHGARKTIERIFFKTIYQINNFFTLREVKRASLDDIKIGDRRKDVVVSLTSYPKRFFILTESLKSLLLQSVHPEKIIVYLGSDSKESDITAEMRSLEKYGIDFIIDCQNNYKAHKKYYYAMNNFSNKVIVTADDDLIYPKDWLESLLNSYEHFPNAISARRVHEILFDEKGCIRPYNTWNHQCRKYTKPSFNLLATGGAGALYPPGILDPEVLNSSVFSTLCLDADDIWMKCMEIYSHVPVVWVKNWSVEPLSIYEGEGLMDENVFESKNDIYLKNVMEYYSIKENEFKNGH